MRVQLTISYVATPLAVAVTFLSHKSIYINRFHSGIKPPKKNMAENNGIQKQIKSVREFHDTFGVGSNETPTLDVGKNIAQLRYDLMREENEEYLEACKKGDLTEVADALGDQLYVLCGTIIQHGMQNIIEEVFDEIHRSNMSKAGEDSKVLRRADGKVIKGPFYSPPQLKDIVDGEVKRSGGSKE